MPVGGPAGALDRLDRIERRAAPFDPGQVALDKLRRGLLATLADAVRELALEAVSIACEPGEVCVVASWLTDEIDEVERSTRRSSGEVGGDRRNDAAGGTGDQEHGVLVRVTGGVVGRVALDESHRPAQPVRMTDLDRTRVGGRLIDECPGHDGRVGVLRRAEIDRLDQRVGALARQRLGETGDRSAEDAKRPGVVIAVTPAETGAADEERRLRQRAHRGGQQFHADVERIATRRRRELRHRTLEVETREPEHAVDRGGLGPLRDLRLERVNRRRALEREHLGAGLGQRGAERIGDATLVGHDRDAAALSDRDAGGQAHLERRAQHRDGDTSRVAVGVRRGERGGLGSAAAASGQARLRGGAASGAGVASGGGCGLGGAGAGAGTVAGSRSRTNPTTWFSVG